MRTMHALSLDEQHHEEASIPTLVFSNTLINAGGRLANGLVQEFILRKHTSNANQ